LTINAPHYRFAYAVALLFAYCAEAGPSDIASYLCIGEQATGFEMNQKTHAWTAQTFRPRKYIIRAPIKGPNAPSGAYTAVIAVYEVGKVDAANFKAFCEKDYNEKGFLFCSGFGEDFNFNRQTLRFVHWFPYGYIDPPGFDLWGKEGDATPFMEIGTCTAI